MKCKNCNAEWNVSKAISASLSECPFCKVSLIEEKAKLVFDNLHDALAAIYADPKLGIDVVLGSKCSEYISDYFPNIKSLVKARIKTISKSGGAAEILKSAMNAGSAEKERAILLAIQKLTDDGDGKDTATDIIYEYVYVLGWKATQFAQRVAPGDTYLFSDINWRVLDIQGDRALLLTEDIVEQRAYNIEFEDVTWESCFLRQYLNREFYNRFSSDDKARILPCTNSNENTMFTSMTGKKLNTSGGANTDDRIFLLSIKEAKRYFKTSYTNTKTYWNDHYPNRWSGFHEDLLPKYLPQSDKLKATYTGEWWWWWLRSPGINRLFAADVNYDGSIYMRGDIVSSTEGGVRPALWVNLKS